GCGAARIRHRHKHGALGGPGSAAQRGASPCLNRSFVAALRCARDTPREGATGSAAAMEQAGMDDYLGADGEHAMDDKTRTELEAAAFRRLLDHLRARTDVQNIDMMNLAGFFRNCLSNWMMDAADAMGVMWC